MVPKITIVEERRTSGASIVSMSSTSSRGRRLDRRGPGPPPADGDEDSLDLPYPQYKRISLYYFEQTSFPRMISLRMMTSPYPFPATTQSRQISLAQISLSQLVCIHSSGAIFPSLIHTSSSPFVRRSSCYTVCILR